MEAKQDEGLLLTPDILRRKFDSYLGGLIIYHEDLIKDLVLDVAKAQLAEAKQHYEQKKPIAEFTSPIYVGEEAVRMEKRLDRPELREIEEHIDKILISYETMLACQIPEKFVKCRETIKQRGAEKLLALIPDIEEAIIQAKKEQMVIDWAQAGKNIEEAKKQERKRIRGG